MPPAWSGQVMPKKNIVNIVVNLELLTKRQMLEWRRGRKEFIDSDDPEDLERHDFEALYQLVIEAWPHGEISFDNYLDLSLPESTRVDLAVTDAIAGLSEKK